MNRDVFRGMILGMVAIGVTLGFVGGEGCTGMNMTPMDQNFVVQESDRVLRDANRDAADMTDLQTAVITEGQQDIITGQQEIVGATQSLSEQVTAEHTEQTPEKAEQLSGIGSAALAAIAERVTALDGLVMGIGDRQMAFSETMGEWKGSRERMQELEELVRQGQEEGTGPDWYEAMFLALGSMGGGAGVARMLGSGKKVEKVNQSVQDLILAQATAAGPGQRFAGDVKPPSA